MHVQYLRRPVPCARSHPLERKREGGSPGGVRLYWTHRRDIDERDVPAEPDSEKLSSQWTPCNRLTQEHAHAHMPCSTYIRIRTPGHTLHPGLATDVTYAMTAAKAGPGCRQGRVNIRTLKMQERRGQKEKAKKKGKGEHGR